MERDQEHQPLVSSNTCKHCGAVFTTLADEKQDECLECMTSEEE